MHVHVVFVLKIKELSHYREQQIKYKGAYQINEFHLLKLMLFVDVFLV